MAAFGLTVIVNNVLIIWGCWDSHRVTANHPSIIIAAKLGFCFCLILLTVVILRLLRQPGDK